ncbi:hypothetical protein J6590_026123 [Homalodisca vitripennis]|nr:hypothetical protein J6590_026123 [Homalodisca vitripennis]
MTAGVGSGVWGKTKRPQRARVETVTCDTGAGPQYVAPSLLPWFILLEIEEWGSAALRGELSLTLMSCSSL